jgi:hypothetical protein
MIPLREIARTSEKLIFVILGSDMDDVGGNTESRDEVKYILPMYGAFKLRHAYAGR